MKKLIFLLLILVLVISCITQKGKYNSDAKILPSNKSTGVFSVADSLNKYTDSENILIVDDSINGCLYINKANNKKYAVWTISDSTLTFYQKQNNHWIQSDKMDYKLGFSYAEALDLNGDNYNDIRISCISGSGGNTENTVFLFDSKTNLFKHNSCYDLPNVGYDKQNNFVKSSWYSGVVHCQNKMKYIISGDSLKFDLGVTFCPDEENEGKTGTVEFYKKVNSEKVTVSKTTGKTKKIWSTFEKSFWNSKND